RVCQLKTGSRVVITTSFSGLILPLTGYQQWVVAPTADANGIRTVSIPASGTHFDKRTLLGQTFCVRAGGDGTGFVDCDGGGSGYNLTAQIDHNTNGPPGDNGGLAADPNCTASFTNPDGSVSHAVLEDGSTSHPHTGACNSPVEITQDGAVDAGGMQLKETLIA